MVVRLPYRYVTERLQFVVQMTTAAALPTPQTKSVIATLEHNEAISASAAGAWAFPFFAVLTHTGHAADLGETLDVGSHY